MEATFAVHVQSWHISHRRTSTLPFVSYSNWLNCHSSYWWVPCRHVNGNYPRTNCACVCRTRRMLLKLLRPTPRRCHSVLLTHRVSNSVLAAQRPYYLRTQSMARQNRGSHHLTSQCPYGQWMERTTLAPVLVSRQCKMENGRHQHWSVAKLHPTMNHSMIQTLSDCCSCRNRLAPLSSFSSRPRCDEEKTKQTNNCNSKIGTMCFLLNSILLKQKTRQIFKHLRVYSNQLTDLIR